MQWIQDRATVIRELDELRDGIRAWSPNHHTVPTLVEAAPDIELWLQAAPSHAEAAVE